MTVIDRIASFQFDPLEVAGRNHDLILLARIEGYRREWTDQLLYEERALFEVYNKGLSILPAAELPYHRITWDRSRLRHEAGAFVEHAPLVEELLQRIRLEGPLAPGDVEPRAAIDWYWRPTNQVRAILEALAESGILGLARRDGNRRIYDLAERLFPEELLARRPAPREQFRHKLLSRYRGHGLLGTSGSAELWIGTSPGRRTPMGLEGGVSFGAVGRRELLAELVEAGDLLPVEVEGVRGRRFILNAEQPLLAAAEAEVAKGEDPGAADPGVSFLAPLDPLVWDREFLRRCYEFDYVWEVYVPAAKRRWGYYVLPLMFGDRLVGRIEPRIDRKADTLRILGAWWEEGFEPLADERFVPALAAALDAHRQFGGVRRVTFPRTARLRPLVAALRPLL
ncbi:MAG TPA: crosslink repair DNA glycosylase YcaQ family protein [Gaiellaceae bacterium]|nr:crosslink repair DNA glycosylase YcaQ family protein [Gaiellaceae bacterium]